MLVAATRQLHGPESMGIVAATGCNTVFGSTYPYNPYLVPWTNSLFENAPAVALGIRGRWDQAGHPDRRLWVLGGDGAMYDIGFQALSRMVASGADIKVLVLDTQVYSNTGGQASTASFGGQVTKLSAFGSVLHGRPEPRKELGRILAAHGNVYVAQTTPAHINHFYRAIAEANAFPGPAVVIAYAACMPEHGIADDAATAQAKLAVDSRAFPLFTYDPRRGERQSERWSLQGNPALRDDWVRLPDGTEVDFLSFARTEGRFAGHFGPDGTPSAEICRPPGRTGSRTGGRSRSLPASFRPRAHDQPPVPTDDTPGPHGLQTGPTMRIVTPAEAVAGIVQRRPGLRPLCRRRPVGPPRRARRAGRRAPRRRDGPSPHRGTGPPSRAGHGAALPPPGAVRRARTPGPP